MGSSDAWLFEANFCRECNRSTWAGQMGRTVPVKTSSEEGRERDERHLSFCFPK